MTDEFPLYVRKEAARLANKRSHGWTACNITDRGLGRAFCQYLLETMPKPVDPLEAVLDAVLKAYHRLALTELDRRKPALAVLRAELEKLDLLKESLT